MYKNYIQNNSIQNIENKKFQYKKSDTIKNYAIFIATHSNQLLKIGIYSSLSVVFNHILF